MILVTVGTQFPFDRLVRAVDEAAGAGLVSGEILAQVGRGGSRPKNMRWVETLEREEFARRVRQADRIVAHAGIGTILTALEAGKPLLVMPRLKRFGEVVNDHQVATAKRFASRGHVLAAYGEDEIAGMLVALEKFEPVPRRVDPRRIVGRVKDFVEDVAAGRGRGRAVW